MAGCFTKVVQILAILVSSLTLSACISKDTAYWSEYEQSLRRAGGLRTERDPPEITFSNAQFLRNFREIMFYDEYAEEDGEFVLKRVPRLLEKRRGETTYTLSGKSVQATDRQQVAGIALRISEAIGIDVRKSEEAADISIFIGDHAERLQLADFFETRYPDSPLVDELRNGLGDNVCVAVPFYSEDSNEDASYLILIPGELSGILRQACIEEEFGQAFGPAADFDGARPSIFNDDQEFALFTAHDELLFRVLYDRRLRAGMSEQEAMPIVERIIAELRPNEPRKLHKGEGAKGDAQATRESGKIDRAQDTKAQSL